MSEDADNHKSLFPGDWLKKGYVSGPKISNGECYSCGSLDVVRGKIDKKKRLLCDDCAFESDIDGSTVFRELVEEEIGIKQDNVVLITKSLKLSKRDARKLTGLPREAFRDVENRLVRMRYLKRSDSGILGFRYKITPLGIAASSTMTKAFIRDADFRVFLQKVNELNGKG